jgi:hypothetical protein
MNLTDDINLARQLEEMRAANQRLQRANSRLKEKQADLVEAVYRASKDAAVMTGRPGTQKSRGCPLAPYGLAAREEN